MKGEGSQAKYIWKYSSLTLKPKLMRKFTLLFSVLLTYSVLLFAQNSTYTGTVKDEQGNPVPYASVVTKKGNNGVAADQEGRFTIKAPAGSLFVISSTGFESKEVKADNTSINVILKSTGNTSEVIVTALGISKSKKSIGYSVQSVSAEELNKLRGTDISAALAGKVAGVQLLGTPGANFGEGNLRIRGSSSLDGANPIYVVDGTVVNLSAINMDDVESLSVLKGPSATAQYGFRGAGGVVLITTKMGKKREPSVTVNSLTEIGKVYLLPHYQDEYGGGYTQAWSTFAYNPAIHPASWAGFNGQKLVEYGADESWGPRMDGTPVREWFSWYQGNDFGKETPFSPHPNSVRDFYTNSVRLNNGVVFEGGSGNAVYRLSYNNRVTKLPNPNAEKLEHLLSFKGSIDVNSKLTISSNINFLSFNQIGERTEGYDGLQQNVSQGFNQWWQRQLDIEKLKDYKNPAGGYKTWNIVSPTNTRPAYWESPYFQLYESFKRAWQNRIYGDVSAGYKILPDLKASVIFRANVLNYSSDGRIASLGLQPDAYNVQNGQSGEYNTEFLVEYKHKFGNFSVEQYVGGNMREDFRRENSSGTVGGLSVPGLYSVSASKDRPTVSNVWNSYKINSIYGRGSVGYKNFLFLDYSLRNDWSSSLPMDKNAYLYPSVSMSFIFTDLTKGGSFNNIVNYGKLRAAYGRVGSDLNPYALNQTYALGTPYGTNPTMNVPTSVYDPTIKPSLSREYEFGTELQFFKNRFGIDFSIYQKDGVDQIVPLTTANSSGSTRVFINAGLIRSKGWDLVLNGQPIKNRDFKWDIQVNIAKNVSEVLNLDTMKNLRNYSLGTASFGPSVNSRVGEKFATFLGNAIRRDAATGLPIINAAGAIQYDQSKNLGSALPDYTGGIVTTFSYKDFSLSATFSFQNGGKFFSTTRKWNLSSGVAAETVGNNDKGNPIRNTVASGGGVRVDGVLATGGAKQTIYVDAQTWFGSLNQLHELFMADASYFKMSELRGGYNLPVSKWTKMIKSANLSVFVRNPWLIYAPAKDWGFDPSELENANSYYEGGQLPSVRSIGVNLSIRF
jgi:TonB-linked SusC/RagA family outer membrane protein